MRLADALTQIAEIHGHLARTEVYRGLRSSPVALTGLCGLAGWMLQAYAFSDLAGVNLALYWVGAALASAMVGGSEIAYNYLYRDDDYARRKTRRVFGQFVPCLAAGVAVTAGLLQHGSAAVSFLPGIWAALFGLGLFSARPYLPRAIGWVGLYYLLASGWLLAQAGSAPMFEGWQVGGTFAIGQLACAIVLYWNLERRIDHG